MIHSFFFCGGHGVQVGGRNYLLPTPTDERRVRTRGTNMAAVVSAMESARADGNIVILGVCWTLRLRGDFDDFLLKSFLRANLLTRIFRFIFIAKKRFVSGLKTITTGTCVRQSQQQSRLPPWP